MTSDPQGRQGKKVLVVDDNVVNLKLVCEILEGEGYDVDRAMDASEAEERLSGTVPDLILMDIALPGTDGLTLTRRLKAKPRLASVPVVALTAFAMKGDDRKALEAGCEGYITKPIDTRRFPEQVAAFLDAPEVPANEGIRVLIVEDDDTDRKLVSIVLAKNGLLVQQKVSADGVLDAIVAQPPDVILLDLRLPGMDGVELARRINADPRTAGTPIVAVTAYPSMFPAEELKAAGIELCIVKPIDTRQLGQTLEGLAQLRGKRLEKP